MKKFILKWGKGSVLGIQAVYKTMTIEEECIDDVDPLVILPYAIKRRVYYVRKYILLKQKETMTMVAISNSLKRKKLKRTDTIVSILFN